MEALALRSRVQDLSVVINQKPTAVCLLSELVQRKLLPPYSVTYDLHGEDDGTQAFHVSRRQPCYEQRVARDSCLALR